MYQYFVYLIKSENRLVILQTSMGEDDNYCLLLMNEGNNRNTQESLAKTFCLGYIIGTQVGISPVNNVYEFQ